MSPTDFFAISTAPERATFDCDMRDGMAPLNEAEAAEKETAAESMVLGCRGTGWMRFAISSESARTFRSGAMPRARYEVFSRKTLSISLFSATGA
jgi:hypothetical protein